MDSVTSVEKQQQLLLLCRCYDLSQYTGEAVRFKFEFDTEDEVSNDHAGWFVDDIIVGHPPLPIPSIGIVGIGILLGSFVLLLRRKANTK